MATLISRRWQHRARIRQRFEQLIARKPQWMLYVRADLDKRCSCYDSFTRARGDWHPECLGLGYQIQLERFPGRRQARPVEERDVALFGQMSQTHPVVFTPFWMHPKENDLVIEVDGWSSDWRPLSVFRMYTVMIALPFSESEISFFALGCNPYDMDRLRILEALRGKSIVLPAAAAEMMKDMRYPPDSIV